MRGTVLAAMIVTGIGTAGAQTAAPIPAYVTGDDLHAACVSGVASGSSFCQGFVLGIADGLQGPSGVYGYRACIPGRVTIATVLGVATTFLRDRADLRHHAAGSLAANAISHEFPCE